ncbi:Uracil-DNA glycosylase [Caldibacillus thermoamylovorans]|jgi:uracil-DNA glycosylase|uniref:Uracil-DNA glycosylase n=1 Tax=Caldibacillus thermoamylovorans TaxID=35841 RepID=A0A090IXI4_9BACI|nr:MULTISPECIES: uracil-DNA glycosylase [Bacillaceae]AWI13602.1 uracil-DNA glycosylase [Caldibacillus thermoamylovorans]MBU5342961.1 uracil-DNA glycosylase [Caldifermentibacillus hisashii]MDL0421181.1 uracil-DNA glycosylase [Caldibacillus thermoamylovorans]MED3642230.1 uracil-DNA glycosylase [Caldifermentibacillus hisashii]MED4853222.1 uracil-DNA glycosylase [Caldifermentibacillus hisashii]
MKKQILKNDWAPLLEEEFSKPYYLQLREFLKQEYKHYRIYPDMYEIFNALHYTAFADVKVVILGQDPYHGPNQAHGLSFSVKPGVPLPPSLKNIFLELQADLGCTPPSSGYLVPWTKQGVLLLNTVLTVREGQAHSHQGKGWEIFTDRVIEILNRKSNPVVYILWGSAAQMKQQLIDTNKHFIIKAPHPSPLSAHRGFFGSKPFSKTNSILKTIGQTEINWQLP